MIRYLMKFLWNSRRSFRSIFIEQMLVSVVLSVCLVSLSDMLGQYRSPGMLDTDNVVLFSCMHRNYVKDMAARPEINAAVDAVVDNARQWDYVEAASETSSLTPYLRLPANYMSDSVTVNGGRKYSVHVKIADEYADKVFGIKIEDGTWLRSPDDGTPPALVSRQLAEEIAPDADPVGMKLQTGRRQVYTVVGVFEGAKEDAFTPAAPSVIIPLQSGNPYSVYRDICFRVRPDHIQEFISALYRECRRVIPHFDTIDIGIHDMGEYKADSMFRMTSRLKLMIVPVFLLVLFAFAGTLGHQLFNAARRAVEVSLYRAVGATRIDLMVTVLLQSAILTLLAAVPSVILAVAVSGAGLSGLYSALATVALMLLFSLASACYPAWKISHVEPAAVLHEE